MPELHHARTCRAVGSTFPPSTRADRGDDRPGRSITSGSRSEEPPAVPRPARAQGIKPSVTLRRVDALGLNIAFIVDPWGTNIELTEGLDKVQ